MVRDAIANHNTYFRYRTDSGKGTDAVGIAYVGSRCLGATGHSVHQSCIAHYGSVPRRRCRMVSNLKMRITEIGSRNRAPEARQRAGFLTPTK